MSAYSKAGAQVRLCEQQRQASALSDTHYSTPAQSGCADYLSRVAVVDLHAGRLGTERSIAHLLQRPPLVLHGTEVDQPQLPRQCEARSVSYYGWETQALILKRAP